MDAYVSTLLIIFYTVVTVNIFCICKVSKMLIYACAVPECLCVL